MSLCHDAPLCDRIDGHDVVAEVHADPGNELSDRAEAGDDERSPIRNVCILDRLPGRRQDVAEEQIALVRQFGADLDGVVVSEGDPQELGLAAGNLPVQLGVAEQRGAGVLVAHLSRLALGLEAALAHEAVSAGDSEGDDDTVTDLEPGDRGTDLLDDPHRFVPEDVATLEERTEQFVEVQV